MLISSQKKEIKILTERWQRIGSAWATQLTNVILGPAKIGASLICYEPQAYDPGPNLQPGDTRRCIDVPVELVDPSKA
ncbi:hypothetical protein Y032_0300g1796 [Ancylostoma ceylanicum]|nr:hypothetical protein Y032_0300g1796 [Ancylostoma ceylanicum]